MNPAHELFMHQALRLAHRAYGRTSPNPLVGAILVKRGKIIGQGYHRGAGLPHAEIEALHHAKKQGESPRGATLYVTLEPCCTHGRTPPCTEAIIRAGIRQVVVAATDPNPDHCGRGLRMLGEAGIEVTHGLLAAESERMNETFNHWIVHHTPFVTLKIAMTLDGKIATAAGDSKWITGERARRHAHYLRKGGDGILVGIETVLQDDPALTVRYGPGQTTAKRRFVLDTHARMPVTAKLVTDEFAAQTTVVIGEGVSGKRKAALSQHVQVLTAPQKKGRIDLTWLMQELGTNECPAPVTSLLVEGGGEVHASFLELGLAHRFTAFYAPKILGGREARRAVGGSGFNTLARCPRLVDPELRRLSPDLMISGRLGPPTGETPLPEPE